MAAAWRDDAGPGCPQCEPYRQAGSDARRVLSRRNRATAARRAAASLSLVSRRVETAM